ncbi:hypothetical protein [Nocardia sp. CY41]|uniref:WD40 repeat domain-containing protein n=1 Tax=Nocardia sp. CY41 TaxID=2608686 RepID=UPI00135C917D
MTTPQPTPQRDWAHTNPYLRRHLTTHATAGELLPELLHHTRFWLYTDIDRLARALAGPDLPDTTTTRLLQRALDTLRTTTDPAERATILHAFALRDESQAIPTITTTPEHPWKPRWTTSPTTTLHRALPGHTDEVNSVAFGTRADGGLLLASGGDDGTVRVWDPETGESLGPPLSGHTDEVYGVAFGTRADGGLLLASASRDETVRLWDPDTGQPLGSPLSGHTDVVRSVAFGTRADGGLLLASGSDDGTVPRDRGTARVTADRPHRHREHGGIRAPL